MRAMLLILCAMLCLEVGTWIGRRIERALRAERPPDAYGSFWPLPEVYRATWRAGELRT